MEGRSGGVAVGPPRLAPWHRGPAGRRPLAMASDHVATHDGHGIDDASPNDDRLHSLVEQLGTDLVGADLEALGSDALRDRLAVLTRLQGMVAVATAATVHRLAEVGAPSEDGAPSTTAWVARTTGASRRQAGRIAQRASALPDLPATTAAMAAGAIGVESADTIISTARDGRLGSPAEVEAALLPVAEHERPERLRAEVRRRTQQVDADAMARDEQRQRQRRRLSLTRRDDGMWDLHGLLPGEVGEQARTLLDAFDHPDPHDTPPEHRRRPDQRMADAFAAAVGVALDLGPLPTAGGIARPHVSVIVDVETFDADLSSPHHDGPVAPDDARWADLAGGEASWGTTLSPQAVRQLCCDAGVSRVVMDGAGQVLDVGRLRREWSPPQRRAVNARDRACRGPGCDRPLAWTHIHHLRWWRRGGRTDISNGIALCPACHDLVHGRGWDVELDAKTAEARWTSPDRRRVITTRPRPPT